MGLKPKSVLQSCAVRALILVADVLCTSCNACLTMDGSGEKISRLTQRESGRHRDARSTTGLVPGFSIQRRRREGGADLGSKEKNAVTRTDKRMTGRQFGSDTTEETTNQSCLQVIVWWLCGIF